MNCAWPNGLPFSVFFLVLFYTCYWANAQDAVILNLNEALFSSEESKNYVEQIYTDSRVSSFYITILDSVGAHFHKEHTEHVVVLSGKGTIWLNGEENHLYPGLLLVIPPGVIHRVKTTEGPLKVLSVQAPFFDGRDRHFPQKTFDNE